MVKDGDNALIVGDYILVSGKTPAAGDKVLVSTNNEGEMITHGVSSVKIDDFIILQSKFNNELVGIKGGHSVGMIWFYRTLAFGMSEILSFDYDLNVMNYVNDFQRFEGIVKHENPHGDNVIIGYNFDYTIGYVWYILNPVDGTIINTIIKEYTPHGFWYDGKIFFIKDLHQNYCNFDITIYNNETKNFDIIDTVSWIATWKGNSTSSLLYEFFGNKQFIIMDNVAYFFITGGAGIRERCSWITIDIMTGEELELTKWSGFLDYNTEIPMIFYDIHDNSGICNNGLKYYRYKPEKSSPFLFDGKTLTTLFNNHYSGDNEIYLCKAELKKEVELYCAPTPGPIAGTYNCIIGTLISHSQIRTCYYNEIVNVIDHTSKIPIGLFTNNSINIPSLHFIEYNNLWILFGNDDEGSKMSVIDVDQMEVRFILTEKELNILKHANLVTFYKFPSIITNWFVNNNCLFISYKETVNVSDTLHLIDVINLDIGEVLFSGYDTGMGDIFHYNEVFGMQDIS